MTTNNATATGLAWAQEGFDDSSWTLPLYRGTSHSVGCDSKLIWYQHNVVNEWIYCRYKRQ